MINKLFSKSSGKVQEAVKAARNRAREEAVEIVQHAQKQIAGGEQGVNPSEDTSQTTSSVTEAMQQTLQPPLSDEETRKINTQFIARTQRLEEEIESYRKKREGEDKQRWIKGGISTNVVGPGEPMSKPLEIPKSKPSRGAIPGAPGTAKGGSGPEVRKSKQ
jgi:hypothetical protein